MVELLKRNQYDLDRLAHEETDADTLDGVDSVDTDPIPVIYQSGYLTIKGYDAEFCIYRLCFPNMEVEEGFVKYLLPYYAHVSGSKTSFEISRLQSFFADTPYETIAGLKPDRDTELHYQNVLFIVFCQINEKQYAQPFASDGRQVVKIGVNFSSKTRNIEK